MVVAIVMTMVVDGRRYRDDHAGGWSVVIVMTYGGGWSVVSVVAT
jgi:hypothetical protein